MTLLQKLTTWQKAQARKEGIDSYMVLPFAALKAITHALPQDEAALLAIKGIGPVKVRKYGRDLLALVAGGEPPVAPSSRGAVPHSAVRGHATVFDEADDVNAILESKVDDFLGDAQRMGDVSTAPSTPHVPSDDPRVNVQTGEIAATGIAEALSVHDFLAQINHVLGSYFSSVRVRGEVIGFKRNQNGHAYFELKDEHAIVRCSVFRDAYERSGVALADGMEVIVTGAPSHHAKYGFSFIGETVELAGEGALKKAYDALKKKCIDEGLFAPERKRSLPALPTRIGLITSPTGAAIGDFTMNVGKFGYHIAFHPSSVEGAQAVKELLVAIKKLAALELDLLVVVRGGGSLESLAAFNNENVVRALAAFPVPVVAGIGHEQDETLTTLVADVGVSTPTAAARAVRVSWDDALTQRDHHERVILDMYADALRHARDTVEDATRVCEHFFADIVARYERAIARVGHAAARMRDALEHTAQQLTFYAKLLAVHDPLRTLAQGYSIVRGPNGKVVREKSDVTQGDALAIQVHKGSIDAVVK